MGPGDRTAPRSPGRQPCTPRGSLWSTYLFLLLVEVVNDDTDEKVQGEERPEDDEHDEVDVHVEVVLPLGLLFILRRGNQTERSDRQEVGQASQGCPEEGQEHKCVSTKQGRGGGAGGGVEESGRWRVRSAGMAASELVRCHCMASDPGPGGGLRIGSVSQSSADCPCDCMVHKDREA